VASVNFMSRRLKLRDLQMLEAISVAGSMARAAELLGISQPTISKVIADLERDLGVPLFDRNSRGAELTPSGDILLRRGRAMLDELQQGLQEIENLSDPTVGEVRITRSLDPHFGLDQEAIKTVKSWRFRPARKNGEPVSVWVDIELSFTLR